MNSLLAGQFSAVMAMYCHIEKAGSGTLDMIGLSKDAGLLEP